MADQQAGAALAQVVARDPINERARRTRIIDTDFHVQPPVSDLRKYMREPFRSKIVRFPVVGTEYQPNFAVEQEGTGQSVLGEARSGEDILGTIEEIGVDTVIVSPGFPRPGAIFQPSVLGAIASAYNDWLIHEVFPVSPRIRGLIMVNQRDAEQAREEIRRCAGFEGFVGVYSEFGPYEPIGSSRHEPLFEALAEVGLPLTLHGSGFWPQFSPTSQGSRTWTELIGVSWPCYAMAFAASLILQGVFEKYPSLRVLVQEGGVWWIPELSLRLDEFYLDHPNDIQLSERMIALGRPYLTRLPSECIADNFYFATQPMAVPKSQKHFSWLLELCGAERRFVYSSDWPHLTFDPVNWVFDNAAVTEELRGRILRLNAQELFPRLPR